MDLEYADIFGDPEDLDELIEQAHGGTGEQGDDGETGGDVHEEQNETEGNAESTEATGDAARRIVKVKKHVKNPQPKLDATRLMGPKGLQIVESMFKDVKFRGKGYEKQDLNVILKQMEHWTHRLFPKMTFSDCLDRIEKLGNKKPVQTYMKKIRMDMLPMAPNLDGEHIIRNHDSDNDVDDPPPSKSLFDQIIERHLEEFPIDDTDNRIDVGNTSNTYVPMPLPPPQPTEISDELHKMLEEKKRLALERRNQRNQERQEQKELTKNPNPVEDVSNLATVPPGGELADLNTTLKLAPICQNVEEDPSSTDWRLFGSSDDDVACLALAMETGTAEDAESGKELIGEEEMLDLLDGIGEN